MTRVTLADVFYDARRGEAWMVLAGPTGRRGLPIFIGSWNASMISGLRKHTRRPLTFQFVRNVLEAVGADLERVQISKLKENAFRATVCLRRGTVKRRIDARPSDAVALAVCMNRTVYVAEALMKKAGRALSPKRRPRGMPASFRSTRWIWAEDPLHQRPERARFIDGTF